MRKFFQFCNRLKPSHLLAVSFLLFIFYTALAPLPQFLIHTGNSFRWGFSLGNYIETIDDQYHGMLETGGLLPTMQDKGTYINLNGFMANLLDQKMMNERVKLKNGHLSAVVETPYASEDIEAVADNLAALSLKQTEQGKHFLFVMSPSQINKYEDLLPEGYTDVTNATADQLLALLEQRGVACLDLRQKLVEDGISHEEAFYKTDHHWAPKTGFWAYTKMLEKLEQLGAIEAVDSFYTAEENFDFTVYPVSFLGSSGKRTGIYYAGLDDSTFIAPKFDTDIYLNIDALGIDNRGRYEEVVYNTWDGIAPEDEDYFNYNSYGLFGWGDQPHSQWRNEGAPMNQKLILIGDSFGNIPYSLMSLYFRSCDELDMRYFPHDFPSYYAQYNPDIVILEVNVDQSVAENTQYPFFPE